MYAGTHVGNIRLVALSLAQRTVGAALAARAALGIADVLQDAVHAVLSAVARRVALADGLFGLDLLATDEAVRRDLAVGRRLATRVHLLANAALLLEQRERQAEVALLRQQRLAKVHGRREDRRAGLVALTSGALDQSCGLSLATRHRHGAVELGGHRGAAATYAWLVSLERGRVETSSEEDL